MSRDYPISLRPDNLPAVVVGGGHGTARRVRDLLQAGALVRLICPEGEIRFDEPPDPARFQWDKRSFQAGDLDQAFVVVSCPGDAALADAVWQAAQKTRVLINTVDDPAHSNFVFPAICRRGDLSIAVSTRGKSPALAVALRDQIAQHFGPEYGTYLDLLGEVRAVIRAAIPGFRNRLPVWKRLLTSDALSRVRAGDVNTARQILLAEIPYPTPHSDIAAERHS